jgi:cob(I)alamin adenosyltransferase
MSSEKLEHGMVSIFTGDGKGKTSAAIGIATRAAGHGLMVFIVFFMKADNYVHGERTSLSSIPNIKFESFGGKGWVDKNNINSEDIEQAKQGFNTARESMLSGEYDVVILDEINPAVFFGLIPADKVLELIKEKPSNVELILTGRNADARVVQAADMVTEMLAIKHPYNNGIQARRGIDY